MLFIKLLPVFSPSLYSYLLAPPVVPGIGLNLHDTWVDKPSQPDSRPDLALCSFGVRGENIQLEARDGVAFLIAKLGDIAKRPKKRRQQALRWSGRRVDY